MANVTTAAVSFNNQGPIDIQNAAYDGVDVISLQDNATPFSTGTIAAINPNWDNGQIARMRTLLSGYRRRK